jgi:hypothetical protein
MSRLTDPLVNQQRSGLADLEEQQAIKIAAAYAKAYRKISPLMKTVAKEAGQVEEGMTGRELVETEAFRQMMQQTLDVFNAFGAELYKIITEGVRDAVALAEVDSVALMLRDVKQSDLAKAKELIKPTDSQDILDRLGLAND